MKILVTAASKHGATDEIAQAIGATLRSRGLDVTVIPAEQVDNLDGYEAVVLGSSVYAGHWLKPRSTWLRKTAPFSPPDRCGCFRAVQSATHPNPRRIPSTWRR